MLDCVVFGRVAGRACAEYMLGEDLQETSLQALSELPVLKPAAKGEAPAASSSSGGAAAAAAASTKKDRTKKSVYDAEKWQGHLRAKTMGWWLKQDAKRQDREAKAAEALRAAGELEAAIKVPAWTQRERTCVDSHYFPMPDEKGSDAVLPWFRESRKSAAGQLWQWTAGWCGSLSDTGVRKLTFVGALLMTAVVSKVTIQFVPHE